LPHVLVIFAALLLHAALVLVLALFAALLPHTFLFWARSCLCFFPSLPSLPLFQVLDLFAALLLRALAALLLPCCF
jgi:hypothetical protein